MARSKGRSVPLDVRFWLKVDKAGPNECWPWVGAIGTDGYGHLWDGTFLPSGGRRLDGAHRISLRLHGIEIPAGMCALHKNICQHKWCVNPAHLYIGDRPRNARDAMEVGTLCLPPVKRGEQHYRAVLTEVAVRAIRGRVAAGESQASLVREFRVSSGLVSMIVARKKWRHVE